MPLAGGPACAYIADRCTYVGCDVDACLCDMDAWYGRAFRERLAARCTTGLTDKLDAALAARSKDQTSVACSNLAPVPGTAPMHTFPQGH